MRWLWLCSFGIAGILHANAQSPVDLNVSWSKGFIVPHTQGIEHLAISHPSAIIISFYRKSFGDMGWQSKYNYPDVGATFIYMNYKNSVLGKSLSIIPNYNFHIFHPEKVFNGHFRIGLGPAYHTNPYDKVDNNKNHMLGSSFSYGIILQANASFRISSRLSAETGLSLIHFSNGSIKKPNTGVNIMTWTTGLTYTFGNIPSDYKIDSLRQIYSEKWHFTTILNGGVSETIKIGTGTFPFFNIQLAADKKLDSKRRVSAGVEYFHTLSLREEIKNDYWLQGETPDFKRLAVVAGYEQIFNRLSAIGQAGYYIYSPYKAFDPFYVRIGLRYAFGEKFFTGISVKSHYFKAEAAEWSVGYRF